MKEREALKLALEALYPISHNSTDDPRGQADKAIIAINNFLAQPEQEPVAWMEKDVLPLTHIIKAIVRREKDETYTEPLYTTPPQRTWVGLTDEEIKYIEEDFSNEFGLEAKHSVDFAQAIEAKLKEKNR